MILTEEEAKTKWCPMAYQNAPHKVTCIASSCMMWKIVPRQARLKDDKTYERVAVGTCGLIR